MTGDVPPTFLVQAMNDPFHVENSLAYAEALKRAGMQNPMKGMMVAAAVVELACGCATVPIRR